MRLGNVAGGRGKRLCARGSNRVPVAGPSTSPLGAVRSVGSAVLLVMLVACGTSPALKNQRVDYWQRKISQDLHIGMSRSEVEAWGESNHLKFTLQYSNDWRPQLVTYAEQVPGSFSLLTGCTGWHVWIGLFFSDSDLMTKSVVRGDPICL